MQDVGHELEAVDQARPGAREVGRGVDGDDALGADRPQRRRRGRRPPRASARRRSRRAWRPPPAAPPRPRSPRCSARRARRGSRARRCRRPGRRAAASSGRPRRPGRTTRSRPPGPARPCARRRRTASIRARWRAMRSSAASRERVSWAIVRTSPKDSPSVCGSRATTCGRLGIVLGHRAHVVDADGAHRAQLLGDDQVGLEVLEAPRRRARRSPRRARCARARPRRSRPRSGRWAGRSRVICGSDVAASG